MVSIKKYFLLLHADFYHGIILVNNNKNKTATTLNNIAAVNSSL